MDKANTRIGFKPMTKYPKILMNHYISERCGYSGFRNVRCRFKLFSVDHFIRNLVAINRRVLDTSVSLMLSVIIIAWYTPHSEMSVLPMTLLCRVPT